MIAKILEYVITIIPMLFAVTIHEAAHGFAAYKMGDDTAKIAGRITLNPIKHLDPFGSFILPIMLKISGSPVLFGYAKPVPINPYYFRELKIGTIIVSAAGVFANMICAVISAFCFHGIVRFQNLWVNTAISPMIEIIYPMLGYSIIINIVLMVFNLIPVPPLDGSRILAMFLPEDLRQSYEQIEKFGMLILIGLIMTKVLDKILDFFVNPLVNFLLRI